MGPPVCALWEPMGQPFLNLSVSEECWPQCKRCSSPLIGQPNHTSSWWVLCLCSAVGTVSSIRKHISKTSAAEWAQREEERRGMRRLVGRRGRAGMLGWGMGRCGSGGVGGVEMWGRQAAEVRLRCKSDEDFWKAKSQRERCCLGALHYKQPELRQPRFFHWRCSTRERERERNYNYNLCMIHLADATNG